MGHQAGLFFVACLLAACSTGSATLNGCKCADNWDYFGNWYHACDARKPRAQSSWCVVDRSSCKSEPHGMVDTRTHGKIGGITISLPISQTAAERGHAWDFCAIDTEQLGDAMPLIEDPTHRCPTNTWSDVVFVEKDGLCAQLCLNPASELHATNLDVVYGTTCVRDGFAHYVKTTTVSRQTVHWYAREATTSEHAAVVNFTPREAKSPDAAPQLIEPPEKEHVCEPGRLADAMHISPPDGAFLGSCQQICLNPVFRGPAEKRGVVFGTTCQAQGYTHFTKEEKNLGQTVFSYRRPPPPSFGPGLDAGPRPIKSNEQPQLDDAAESGDAAQPLQTANETNATARASSRKGGHRATYSTDLSTLRLCPIVVNPDLAASEAMRILCRRDADVDCSALPGFLALLGSSQPDHSHERQTFTLSAHAISFICDTCTEPLRQFIVCGANTDPPPSEVRSAVCASAECAASFDEFFTSLGADENDVLDKLCELEEPAGNRAMGELLASLAVHIEEFMGLSGGRSIRAALLTTERAAKARVRGRALELPMVALFAFATVAAAAAAAAAARERAARRAENPIIMAAVEHQPGASAGGSRPIFDIWRQRLLRERPHLPALNLI